MFSENEREGIHHLRDVTSEKLRLSCIKVPINWKQKKNVRGEKDGGGLKKKRLRLRREVRSLVHSAPGTKEGKKREEEVWGKKQRVKLLS